MRSEEGVVSKSCTDVRKNQDKDISVFNGLMILLQTLIHVLLV